MADLTPKQQRFVDEYLVDLNATQAAIRAGYSEHSASAIASENLGKPEIQTAIDIRRQDLMRRTEITQDRVLRELAALAFSNVQNFTVDGEGYLRLAEGAPEGAWASLSSVKYRTTVTTVGEAKKVERDVEFRMWDKPGPLKLAGQHVGLFRDDPAPIRPETVTVNILAMLGELPQAERLQALRALNAKLSGNGPDGA